MKIKLMAAVLLTLMALTAAFLFSPTVSAQEEEQTADKTLSPYFFVKGDPAIDHLPLKDTNVDINISGVIADVRVTQTYTNEGTRPINATYVFPASTRAAVYAMQMQIGDEIIYAKIKEREAAKKEFEKAKEEGKSASLLEEHRPNVFSMSLANMMPGEQVRIELRYTELISPTDGEYEMVYPTVVGPRYASEAAGRNPTGGVPYTHSGTEPASTLHITTRVSAGMPIREITCPSHQIAPEWRSPALAELKLDEANAFQGNRDFVLKYKLSGDKTISGLLLFQGKDENFFLYMAQPPERVDVADIPPRDYVFVVDVSGSMTGFPLDTAKTLLTDLIDKLRPTDTFNVVLFSGDSQVLSPQPLEANRENVARAIHLIDEQRGGGGTELLPALQEAMGLPRNASGSRNVVLVTDGYISAEPEVFDYIRENAGRGNVFSFGIGSSVNRYLIEGVAKAGSGEPFVITDPSQAAGTAEKFREYIQSPLLTDVQIKAQGFEVYDVEPGHMPDLLARRPILLYGKWRGSPTGTLQLTGKSGLGAYQDVFDVGTASPDETNGALRYLWARSRIGELSDYGVNDPSAADVQQITDLGLKYNLLTKYTSFIAVRERLVNPNGNAENVEQPLPMPLGVSDMAIGDEPELAYLVGGILLAAAALIIRRRRGPGLSPLF